MRPRDYATDDSPDKEWVLHALDSLGQDGRGYDFFSILRPTSPFRTAETIRRAHDEFSEAADSLRAVEKCAQHPAKMWIVKKNLMTPLLPMFRQSMPYGCLPEVYVQNASLEMAWVTALMEYGDIDGAVIMPFMTHGNEGFDINTEDDWKRAEIIAKGM